MVFDRVLARTLQRLLQKQSVACVDVSSRQLLTRVLERRVRESHVRGFLAKDSNFFSLLMLPGKNSFHEDFVSSKI